MSRFDDDLRRAARHLASESLPPEVLDDALGQGSGPGTGWRLAGVAVAAVVTVAMIGGGFGQWVGRQGDASPQPTASDSIKPTPSESNEVAKDSPSPAPSHSPSAAPTPSTPVEPVTVAVEDDGIRVTLTLDRNRVSAGERVWADVTVENIGIDSVWWTHSGTCAWGAGVTVDPPVVGPFDEGRDDWSGDLAIVKELATWDDFQVGFTPADWVDATQNFACTTDAVRDEVEPGVALMHRAAWDAYGAFGLQPRPATYSVVATFAYDGRGAPPDYSQGEIPKRTVSVAAELVIDGHGAEYVSPGVAVDHVLADEHFIEALDEAPRSRWSGIDLEYQDGTWILQIDLHSPAEAIYAIVDGASGEVQLVDVVPISDAPLITDP